MIKFTGIINKFHCDNLPQSIDQLPLHTVDYFTLQLIVSSDHHYHCSSLCLSQDIVAVLYLSGNSLISYFQNMCTSLSKNFPIIPFFGTVSDVTTFGMHKFKTVFGPWQSSWNVFQINIDVKNMKSITISSNINIYFTIPLFFCNFHH